VRATANGTTITLSWQPPASTGGVAVDRYIVWRATGSDAFVRVAEPTTTSVAFTNLLPGTRFSFRVFAHNARGWSAMSNTVSALTAGVPEAPADVTANAANGSVFLRWRELAYIGYPRPTGFSVQRDIGGSWTTVAAMPAWTSSCTIAGLTNGTTYRFRVIARNENGISPPSAVITARPIAPPSWPRSLTSRWEVDGRLTLSWQPPATDNGYPVTGYQAQWWDGSRWASATAMTTATSVTFSVAGRRTFRVLARNVWGFGPSSNQVTPGPPPAG
jgi:titin